MEVLHLMIWKILKKYDNHISKKFHNNFSKKFSILKLLIVKTAHIIMDKYMSLFYSFKNERCHFKPYLYTRNYKSI